MTTWILLKISLSVVLYIIFKREWKFLKVTHNIGFNYWQISKLQLSYEAILTLDEVSNRKA